MGHHQNVILSSAPTKYPPGTCLKEGMLTVAKRMFRSLVLRYLAVSAWLTPPASGSDCLSGLCRRLCRGARWDSLGCCWRRVRAGRKQVAALT